MLWQQEDATSMLPSIAADARTGTGRCACGCATHGREYVLDDGRESLTLGRAEENDVVVKGSLISRIHARVEMARSKVAAGGPEHQRLVRDHAGRQGGVRAP
ncbi:MAG: FHA domain-containing protein [Chromatiales bacterium]|nr:FHA domain-containing protein [Chromatiales bacterium]